MPRQRPPKEIWKQTRRRIWLRDKGRCQGPYCQDKDLWTLLASKAHVDHIHSGKLGSNADDNLRLLCRRCHVLRNDQRHRGMIAQALADGLIPHNWRELLWDEDDIAESRPACREVVGWHHPVLSRHAQVWSLEASG